MASRFALFVVVSLFSLFLVGGVNALCLICEDGVQGINWHFHKVDSSGTTCVQKAVTMASDLTAGSWECQENIAEFREMCCGENEPNDVIQVPTKPPTYNGPIGNYQKCDICRDGDYPGNTAMVINMLYIGYGSCRQFYDYGQAGLIQDHLCQPLQHFAYEPCGCGEFNTDKNNNPGFLPLAPTTQAPADTPEELPPSNVNNDNGPPTKPPQKLTLQTTPKPTLRPTNRPTNRPTSQPTTKPTARPTSDDKAKSMTMKGGMNKDKRRLQG